MNFYYMDNGKLIQQNHITYDTVRRNKYNVGFFY